MTRYARGLSFREAFFLTYGFTAMCTECGAPGDQCEQRFHACLAKEFEDSRYGAVHHLTVSAFMLQHSSQLTREGWLYERELLRDFLVNHKLPSRVRQENKARLDGGQRKFRIRSRDAQPKIPHVAWSQTILDVQPVDALGYCQAVTAWAASVLKDSETVGM